MKLLLTGGAGYIGSHTALAGLRAGHEVFLVDDFSNSESSVIDALRRASNTAIPVAEVDIRDTDAMRSLLGEFRPDAILHFAGVKSVGESVKLPRKYYDINVAGTLSLMEAMEDTGITNMVFFPHRPRFTGIRNTCRLMRIIHCL